MKKLVTLIALVMLAAMPAALTPGGARAAEVRADKVDINFVDVDIASMVRVMSVITGKNFIYDETLKGKITVIAPMKLTSSEAFDLFLSALQLKSYAVVPAGKSYKIIPAAQARQSPAEVYTKDERVKALESYIVRVIPLKYVSTGEAFPFVQPLVSRFGQISVFGSRNALMVVDTAMNIKKILDVIASVDTAPEIEEPEVVYLNHSRADIIAEMLRIEARRSGMIPATGGAQRDDGITPDERLNAIVLSGPLATREYLKRFIAVLDIPSPEASSRINVYYLENAEAVEIAKVLEDLIKASTSPAGRPGAQPGGSGAISVTPDKTSNSLIIMASPADYQGILQVIRKLDRRPKQVFVEAMITEVKVDKALDLGTKWRIMGEKGGEPVAIGGVGTVDQSAIQTIINGMAGITAGGLGNFVTVPVTASDGTTFNLTAPGFAVLFSLSQFKDVVNVLSTPHILTSDNSEAEIIVGENVPFLSKIERESTTPAQPVLQSIERKDVGIKLKIKPKVSEGGFVKLDIYQEISAVSPTTTVGASDLITTKRSAKTTVVVKNNQTVVIGGLIENRETENSSKVPLLGDLPLLGWLFRFDSTTREKTNLLVFITPYIVEDFKDLDRLKHKKQEEFDRNAPDAEKTGKRAPDETDGATTGPAMTESTGTHAAPTGTGTNREAAPSQTDTPAEALPETTARGMTAEPAPSIAPSPAPEAQAYARPAVYTPPPEPARVYDITDVRTGMHDSFDRIVVELSGATPYSVKRRGSTVHILVRDARAIKPLKEGLATRVISGVTLTELKGAGGTAHLEVSFKEGAVPRQSIRKDPFRIVVDFYPKK